MVFKRKDNPNDDIWDLILKLEIFTFINKENIFDLPTHHSKIKKIKKRSEIQGLFGLFGGDTHPPTKLYFYTSSTMLHINK